MNPDAVDAYDNFKFVNKGGLAYVGASKGVAELKNILWDTYPAVGRTIKNKNNNNNTGSSSDDSLMKRVEQTILINGYGAFAIWRSLYFSRLLSLRNRVQVAVDWARTTVFGRTISSPHVVESGKKE